MSEQNDRANDLRVRLEDARARMLQKHGEKRVKLVFRTLPAIVLAAILLIALFLLIPIREIEVTGEVELFNEGEIIEASESVQGRSLHMRSSSKIEKTIRKNLPLTESVKVTKGIFGKIKIDIQFSDVYFYCNIGDKYYAIDENLRVLDIDDSYSKYKAFGAVKVHLPEVREPILGESLVFYDTVEETDTEGELLYEVKKPSYYSYVSEFLTEIKENGYQDGANAALLAEKFNVRLIYAEKFSVRFGDIRDLDLKFRIFYEIMAENSTQYADKVTVDLTDPSEATARADTSLDFSEYID